jgi:hypothetical protein
MADGGGRKDRGGGGWNWLNSERGRLSGVFLFLLGK